MGIFILLEMIAVFGLGSVGAAILVMSLFVLHQAAEFIIYFCMDVSLESETKEESTTGRKRGVYLTMQNIAWVISPVVVSFLISGSNSNISRFTFSNVYFVSGVALAAFFLIVLFTFRDVVPSPSNSSILGSLRSVEDKDTLRALAVQFFLNFYYAWMVIYLPLLLGIEIGFEWSTIAFLLTVMLLPFLLFELPAGYLADKKYGEKETMVLGFIILVLSTAIIPFIHTRSFFLWATILFITRVGASLIEIMVETYFFKHVRSVDSAQISLFRITRSVAFLIAPIVAIPVISLTSFGGSFFFLAIISLFGLLFIPKKDTK
jgi:MFS family permease